MLRGLLIEGVQRLQSLYEAGPARIVIGFACCKRCRPLHRQRESQGDTAVGLAEVRGGIHFSLKENYGP